jgi:hypothetical protein
MRTWHESVGRLYQVGMTDEFYEETEYLAIDLSKADTETKKNESKDVIILCDRIFDVHVKATKTYTTK